MIGLVAAELSAETSTALVAEALDRLDRWCTRQWTDVTPRPPAPKASPPPTELYTCPVEGTVLLVVARFMARSDDQWRVSMTVIDAS